MSQPRILFINRIYPPDHGATGRMLHDLTQDCVARGWHVRVLTTGAHRGCREEDGVIVHRVKAVVRPRRMVAYALIWLKLLMAGAMRRDAVDIVVSMTDPPMTICIGHYLARWKKARHIHWSQDVYPDIIPALDKRITPWMYKIAMSARQKAYDACDSVVALGDCMAQALQKGGAAADRMVVIPNWADQCLYEEHPDTPAISQTQGVGRPFESQKKKHHCFRILYAGNLGLAHPLDTILDAAEILQDEGHDVEFVFIGDGARHEELIHKRDVKRLDNIRILPFQPLSQLKTTLEAGDVHLISMDARARGFMVPSKLYSAFAVSRPAIFVGGDACETAQAINLFAAGSLVAQGNAAALAEVIKAYRYDETIWFEHHDGAMDARLFYTPEKSLAAWADEIARHIPAPSLPSVPSDTDE